MNKFNFLHYQNQRLDQLEVQYGLPTLRMWIIDHNKPREEWPVVQKLTEYDMVIEIEKSPVTT